MLCVSLAQAKLHGSELVRQEQDGVTGVCKTTYWAGTLINQSR